MTVAAAAGGDNIFLAHKISGDPFARRASRDRLIGTGLSRLPVLVHFFTVSVLVPVGPDSVRP